MSPNRFHAWTRIRSRLPLLCAALAVLLLPRYVSADLIVSVESVSAGAGSTGNMLEVDLTNSGSSSATIGGFSFGLSTTTSNIDFTSATSGTTNPYIFAGDSGDLLLVGLTHIDTSNGQSLAASDFSFSGLGDSVGAGDTVGLGEVYFNVASGTPLGAITVTLTPYPTTSLSDPLGVNIPTTLDDGKITVAPAPSTLLLAALACPVGVWISWRRKRSVKGEARDPCRTH